MLKSERHKTLLKTNFYIFFTYIKNLLNKNEKIKITTFIPRKALNGEERDIYCCY